MFWGQIKKASGFLKTRLISLCHGLVVDIILESFVYTGCYSALRLCIESGLGGGGHDPAAPGSVLAFA